MRLRLYHHHDGARVAYREAGTGPPLALLHSAFLSHMEFEPLVEHLSDRFRVVLPDLPLHGDSEDQPRHPYSLPWFADVMAGFVAEVLGPRPLIAGHGAGAEIALEAVRSGALAPSRLVVMPTRLRDGCEPGRRRWVWRAAARAGALPGLDRVVTHAARLAFRPETGLTLSARANPAARDLLRHAFADVDRDPNRARAWAKCARNWPHGPRREVPAALAELQMPVLLLWADEDRYHELAIAEEALALLRDGQLRVLPSTGYLIAYDDPVGVARELVSFCG